MRYLLPFLLLLFSCGQKEERPEGLLEREEFIQVLTEAQVIEARMNHEMVVEHRTTVPMNEYYQEVFDLYETDRDQFRRTFEYYSERPEELKAIYEEVLVELLRRKDEPVEAQEPSQDTLQ